MYNCVLLAFCYYDSDEYQITFYHKLLQQKKKPFPRSWQRLLCHRKLLYMTPTTPLKTIQVMADVSDYCACVKSNLVTRLVSIPIVSWDSCTFWGGGGGRKRNYISLLWEPSYLAAKQGTPHTREDVNPLLPQSTYVRSLQTAGLTTEVYFPSIHLTFPQLSTAKPNTCENQSRFWKLVWQFWNNNVRTSAAKSRPT